MSTNVNVTVTGTDLLDRSKLQQSANRQAQLKREADQRLAREAEIERVNALAAQGKDANGNRITSTDGTASFAKPKIDLRPAADRKGFGIAAARVVFGSLGGEYIDNLAKITPAYGDETYTFEIGAPYPQDYDEELFEGDTDSVIPDPGDGLGCTIPNGGATYFETELLTGIGCSTVRCWAPGLRGYTDQFIKEYGRLWTNGISAYKYIVFPLGKDSMIISFMRMIRSFYAYSYGYNVVSQNSKIVVTGGNGFPCPGLTGTGQETVIANTDLVGPIVRRSYVPATYLSVLINRSSAREINTPSLVRDVLQDWGAEEHTISTSTLDLKTFSRAYGVTVDGYQPNGESIAPYTITQEREFYTRLKTEFFPPSNMVAYLSTNLSATPSIYASVVDPNTRSVSSSIGGLNQTANYATYYSSLPNTRSTAGLGFIRVDPLPDNKYNFYSSNSLGPGGSLSNPRLLRSFTFNNDMNIFAWNWNDESFCRARLDALGYEI